MKTLNLFFIILIFFINTSKAQNIDPFNKGNILELMDKVNTYQFKNPENIGNDSVAGWIRAVYYNGVIACYHATGDKKYLNHCDAYGEEKKWGIIPLPVNSIWAGPNGWTISQTWLESYMAEKKKYKIQSIIKHLDRTDVLNPVTRPMDYYWEQGKRLADELYVGPPALAMLYKVTKNPKYLAWMDSYFWDTYGHLYNTKDHLFYRDYRFRPEFENSGLKTVHPPTLKHEDVRTIHVYHRTKNGKQVFWSRGNGWAFAGTTRILKYIPKDYGNYNRYKILFTEMAAELKKRQQPDGFWYPNLDDPEDYNMKESTGTGFFTYGLAWGINNGILSREEYLPVVEKAWAGLVSIIRADGKVQWGQRVADSPFKILEEDTREYAAGIFLLAASEIYKMK